MNNDETGPTAAGRQTEERVPVQGSIESVGIREVLQLALAHAPARLVLRSPHGAETQVWCTAEGYGTTERATGPEEVLAEALTLLAGTFEIITETAPDVECVPPPDALAAAEVLAPLWAEVIATIPDPHVAVRLRRRAPSPLDVTATQWRVLAQVGRGRDIGDLAVLLRSSERASRRVVAELVSAGLVEVVHVAQLLTAPPTGPALAPPPRALDGALPPPPPAPLTAPTIELPGDETSSWAEPMDVVASIDDVGTGAIDEFDDAEIVVGEFALEGEPGSVVDASSDWDDEPSAPHALPAVADSWGAAPSPVTPTAMRDWDWSDEPATDDAGHGWDKPVGPRDAPIEWDPEPEAPEGHVRPAPTAVPGFIEDPIAASDEVLGSTDEELVNRALLFKFLSSVRE